jgi:hypothetical protein
MILSEVFLIHSSFNRRPIVNIGKRKKLAAYMLDTQS